jgi:hypothetical protein
MHYASISRIVVKVEKEMLKGLRHELDWELFELIR